MTNEEAGAAIAEEVLGQKGRDALDKIISTVCPMLIDMDLTEGTKLALFAEACGIWEGFIVEEMMKQTRMSRGQVQEGAEALVAAGLRAARLRSAMISKGPRS